MAKPIDAKFENKTTLKISQATLNEGHFIVDEKETNLMELIEKYFDGCIFDITVTQKDSKDLNESE